MRTLWRARIARDAGAVRAPRRAAGRSDPAPGRPPGVLLAQDLRPVPGLPRGTPAARGRPPGQIPRLGIRGRDPGGAPPLAGGPRRRGGPAEEDEAARLGRPPRVRVG